MHIDEGACGTGEVNMRNIGVGIEDVRSPLLISALYPWNKVSYCTRSSLFFRLAGSRSQQSSCVCTASLSPVLGL